jgi:DNA-directed RNA polymerase alpha subunit
MYLLAFPFLIPVPAMQDQNSPSIDELNLSTRSYNCLRRSGLHTIAQVAALSDEELLSIRNLGRGTLIDVHQKLGDLFECLLPKIAAEGVVGSGLENVHLKGWIPQG